MLLFLVTAVTAGIVFTHRPKIRFFAPQGDSLHRFRSNFAVPTGTWVRLPVHNFTSIGADMRECGPKNIKNFHFLAKSLPAGATPLTDFQIFRVFYTPNDPTLAFQISCNSRHRLRSYCGETERR